MRDSFLNALHRKNKGPPPIWLMRQAGRYLPEYRELRRRHSFLELAKQRELIVQTTLLPIQRFDFDAAILFSDILLPFELLGYTLNYPEGGPQISGKRGKQQPARALFASIAEAIAELKEKLTVPLIGFCGSAWTLARYHAEELERLADVALDFLELQMEAGVDAVQLFDTWAGELSPEEFRAKAFPHLQRLARAVHARGLPLLVFMRGGAAHLALLEELEPHAISIGHEVELGEVRRKTARALQGNLDPQLLTGEPLPLERAATELLRTMQGDQAFIVNLSHGVTPQARPELVELLVQRVRQPL